MRGREAKIIDIVDHTLSQLGESVKIALYWHLENEFKIKKEDIPKKPRDFMKALEAIYGTGAIILEQMIVGQIVEELGIESKAKSFPDVVKEAKKQRKGRFLNL